MYLRGRDHHKNKRPAKHIRIREKASDHFWLSGFRLCFRVPNLQLFWRNLPGMRLDPRMALLFMWRLARRNSLSSVLLFSPDFHFSIFTSRSISQKPFDGFQLVCVCPFVGRLSFVADSTTLQEHITTKGEIKVTQEKTDMYVMTNQKYLPAEKIVFIKQKLLEADEAKFQLVSAVEFKDPTTILLVSIFLGSLGIDRFMLGETGMGILKLLTLGCCGILTVIDWFSVQKKAKELNYNNLMLVL